MKATIETALIYEPDEAYIYRISYNKSRIISSYSYATEIEAMKAGTQALLSVLVP